MTDPQVTGKHIDISLFDLTKGYEKGIKDNYYLLFMIDVKDRTIGFCNIWYHNEDPKSKAVDVGVFIGEADYWGKGIGTNAMLAMLDYAFNTLKIDNVIGRYNPNNERVKRMNAKIGFTVTGQFENSYMSGNKKVVETVESAKLSRKDFEKRRETSGEVCLEKT
jgi:RimJ/RimL family protein N-acetyltransferase